MDESLISVNESTVEGIGRLAKYFGFAEIIGRLYGTLLMSPEPMSLDDLGSQLEISKGSVSMNMRSLERWGMAKEIWVRGERKKYYAAEHDLWQVIRNVLASVDGNKTRAAEILGIDRKTLRKKLGKIEYVKSFTLELLAIKLKIKITHWTTRDNCIRAVLDGAINYLINAILSVVLIFKR